MQRDKSRRRDSKPGQTDVLLICSRNIAPHQKGRSRMASESAGVREMTSSVSPYILGAAGLLGSKRSQTVKHDQNARHTLC